MNRRLFALSFALSLLWRCAAALADFDVASSRGSDLTGVWTLNTALSDDPQRMLAEQLVKERRRFERQRRQEELSRPPDAPPAIDVDAPPPNRPGRRPWQERREENFRKMLGVTSTLNIRQSGALVEMTSAVESRRLIAGSSTQVSMPEGLLADSEVGWDGEWFVIERKVHRGPRVIEKCRLLKKTGQLEYTMAWSGDTELAGIRVRRVFDRAAAGTPAANPEVGPIR